MMEPVEENNPRRNGLGQSPTISLTPAVLFGIGMLFFFLAAGIFAYIQLIAWPFRHKIEQDAPQAGAFASRSAPSPLHQDSGAAPSPSIATVDTSASATPSVVETLGVSSSPVPIATPTATVTPNVDAKVSVSPPTDPLPAPEPSVPPREVSTASQNAEAPPPVVKDRDEEQTVRRDVLRRIDMLRGLSQAERDRLYAKVDRARKFSKLAIIPFPLGRSLAETYQVNRLLSCLQRPDVQSMFDDPTIVLVVLGYSDKQGSEAQNLELSRLRAENMVRILKTRTKISNLMRAVGMGSSDLYDRDNFSKNRVVEIWSVEP